MRRKKLIIFAMLMMSVLALAGERVAPTGVADSFKPALLMPKGAILYIQSKDLGAQLQTWFSSSAHANYFKSANYKEFASSRLFLKFQDRAKEFESATGIVLDEKTLAASFNGQSALALYDIGDLEFVFTTEVASGAAANSLIMQRAAKLEARKQDGVTYYIKTIQSEVGGEERSFAFTIIGNRIIAATRENLIKRALKNINANSTDRLLDTVVATATQADGFIAHDITLWLDQSALNKDRYFKNYWIHQNIKELSAINKALIDLELSPTDMRERRWLLTNDGNGGAVNANSDFAGLLKFAPADAELISARQLGNDRESLYNEMQLVFFGRERAVAPPQRGTPPNLSTASDNSDGSQQYQRYLFLDERFDQDIDSQELAAQTAAAQTDSKRFLNAIAEVVDKAQPLRFAVVAEPVLDPASSFVSFNRAVIVELAQPANLAAARLEASVSDELRQRYVINGSNVKLSWQGEAGNARSLAQALIEHGGAYALMNNYLIVANSREYLARLTGANAAVATDGAKLERFAIVRLRGGQAAYDKLMRRLDGVGQAIAAPVKPVSAEDDEVEADQTNKIRLFSENISSLLSVTGNIDTVTFQQSRDKGAIKEQVDYKYAAN